MTLSRDNGQHEARSSVARSSTPPEVRINLTILEVNPQARCAFGVTGPSEAGHRVKLVFPPEVADVFDNLVGKQAWVDGDALWDDELLLSAIKVKGIEEGSNWVSPTEYLDRAKSRPPKPTDWSKVPTAGFDFDVDEFLELVYEGRGRSWAESKVG